MRSFSLRTYAKGLEFFITRAFPSLILTILTSKTRVIDRSEPFGIPPVVVHPDCDKELKTALRETFLLLASKPETAEILSQLQIDRFTLGTDSDYNSVRQIQHHCDGNTDP